MKLNLSTSSIELSTVEAKEAFTFGTDAYKNLQAARHDYPGPLNGDLEMIEFVGAEAKVLEACKADISETTKAKEVRIAPEAKLDEQTVAIKPVHAKLGPTFKGQAKAIISAVSSMPLEEVAKQLASGSVVVDVDGQKVSVGAEFFEAEKRLMLEGKVVETVQIGKILALIEQ